MRSAARPAAASAASIGTSLIARAASSTSRGSESLRNRATSASPSRRKASRTPIRTAGDPSAAARFNAVDIPRADQPHDGGVPQVSVLVRVVAEHFQQRPDGLRPAQLAQRHRGEQADARAVIGEPGDQPVEGLRFPDFAQHLGRLGADLGLGVFEQRAQ